MKIPITSVQIVEKGEARSSLRVHAAWANQRVVVNDDYSPMCGTVPRPWNGHTMVVTLCRRGEGVTCARCLHILTTNAEMAS